jgi:hypothetical protein
MEPATLHQSIVEFLNSPAMPHTRCACGAMKENRETTFFYEGQRWELELPVCMKCNPSPVLVAHDA